ncbi:MAG TPA: transposase, partial [Phycisphaerae bacterium]
RFIVTNRPGAALLPEGCYDEYVGRGESENRNKEIKNGVAGDRLSCQRFLPNYLRLMLHAAALNLLVRLPWTRAGRAALACPGSPVCAAANVGVTMIIAASGIRSDRDTSPRGG